MTRPMLPRRYIRRPVSLPVQCRTQAGMRDEGEISDISVEGCCIRPRSLFFRVGTRVIIRPEGMEALTGVVRWNKNDVAGIEFDRPIYAPVVDHLAQRHAIEP
ncbi:PilZ domain-containing protein [Novosphingobium sp. PP1Y]|uniref:PilZ domain-containing protein n=1 Tax=Novosphingobium sp. PP1Y TaxID=702113 RepID=UPI0008114FEE|nr:PilZ domain-containing protein [Novosphingobium sp. PP1Y]